MVMSYYMNRNIKAHLEAVVINQKYQCTLKYDHRAGWYHYT